MLSALVVAGLAVIVEGDTTCPTAARVSEMLATLVVDAADRPESHRARLREHKGGVELELRSSKRTLGRRTFASEPSCDALASAIAVVIATWEAEFAGDAPQIDVAAPPPIVVGHYTRTWTIGGGGLVVRDRSGWAYGGIGEVAVGATDRPWALRVAALAMTTQRDALAPGEIAWARHALLVGGRYQLATNGAIAIDAMADLALGLMRASGRGFTENDTSYSFDPGLAAGVRASWKRGRVGVVAELTDTVWWLDGHLEVTGIMQNVDLPRHEVHFTLGLSFDLVGRRRK